MHVFVTGASGWVGTAVVADLIAAGHTATGLVRSDHAASALAQSGGTVLRGTLDDLDVLTHGATTAEAVVHLANKHDWANPAEMNRAERAAVQALGDALVGTGRPLLIASAVAGVAPGALASETDPSPAEGPESMRGGSENLALSYADRGVRALAARFAPSVHGHGDGRGFVGGLVRAMRTRGVSGFIGDGRQAWSAVGVADTARLIRLGIERAPAGTRLHAVAEEGIETRVIAQALALHFGVPTATVNPAEALAHFGPVGRFFGQDIRASSALTRDLLGWTPTAPTLLEDIAAGCYDAI